MFALHLFFFHIYELIQFVCAIEIPFHSNLNKLTIFVSYNEFHKFAKCKICISSRIEDFNFFSFKILIGRLWVSITNIFFYFTFKKKCQSITKNRGQTIGSLANRNCFKVLTEVKKNFSTNIIRSKGVF
jgi:hypothetical protein